MQFMKNNTLNIIRDVGLAIQFLGFGIMAGVYLPALQVSYAYLVWLVPILAGLWIRIWATRRINQKSRSSE